MNLPQPEAEKLLNDPSKCAEVLVNKQRIAVQAGKIYAFQPDQSVNQPSSIESYHGYMISGNEVYTKYPSVSHFIANLLGVSIKVLSRSHDI